MQHDLKYKIVTNISHGNSRDTLNNIFALHEEDKLEYALLVRSHLVKTTESQYDLTALETFAKQDHIIFRP